MSNIMIKPGTPPELARAIADGALRAENEALKKTIDKLLCEIAQKDELIELYRWSKTHSAQRTLDKYRAQQARPTMLKRIAAALCSLMA